MIQKYNFHNGINNKKKILFRTIMKNSAPAITRRVNYGKLRKIMTKRRPQFQTVMLKII